ncbi:MAG: hypothetical protein HRJ53_04910 [Acidobacteria bacterium Pan2503]|uniref:Uncharacterized protein n=1 Tax=Candidatus Acidiferrum panamense TaxID=2741543 RepID=A0A7V8SW55_9BACT|nr:hypothetical protein [Candidatus Acidoferrum panamensis]
MAILRPGAIRPPVVGPPNVRTPTVPTMPTIPTRTGQRFLRGPLSRGGGRGGMNRY